MQQGGGGAGRGFQGSGGGRGAGGGGGRGPGGGGGGYSRGPGGGGRGPGGGGRGPGGGGYGGPGRGGPGGGGPGGPGGPGGGHGGGPGGGHGGGFSRGPGRGPGGGGRGPGGGGEGGYGRGPGGPGGPGGGFSRGPGGPGGGEGGFARGPGGGRGPGAGRGFGGGPGGEGGPSGGRPGGGFRPGGFKAKPGGGFRPGGFKSKPGGFKGKQGGGFGRGAGGGGRGPGGGEGGAPGGGSALPSKSWGASGGARGGQKGGFRRGGKKGGFGGKGHAQERFGGHLPPPPVGAGGRPLDVEEEMARGGSWGEPGDGGESVFDASGGGHEGGRGGAGGAGGPERGGADAPAPEGAISEASGADEGEDDGGEDEAGGDDDSEDDSGSGDSEGDLEGEAEAGSEGEVAVVAEETVTKAKKAPRGRLFAKEPREKRARKPRARKGESRTGDAVGGASSEAGEQGTGTGTGTGEGTAEDEAESEDGARPKAAKPFFGRAADAEGRSPKLKQRPGDFQVREVVDLPKEVTSPPADGAPGTADARFFIHVLAKKKLTTPEAITLLSKRFDIPKSAFSFGGLKDKQAFSEQLISIEGRAIEHREAGLKVRPVGRRATPITSDDIRANAFEIVVRGLSSADVKDLATRIGEVVQYGFPNYFDSQRFGSVKFGQGFFARPLVRGDPEGALRLYMATPSPRDHSSDHWVKQIIAERWGDWEGLSRRMHASPYGRILGHLAHSPEDFMGAIGYMSRSLRAIHLFAYQSLIWNNAVQFYLREALPKEARFTVPYQCGRLIFWKRLLPETAARFDALSIPLVGPETNPEDPHVKAAVDRSLKTEGVGVEAFKLPEAAGGFFRDEPRALVVRPAGLRASEPVPDELNQGRLAVTLNFELPRGAYGTLVVKRLFRG